MGCEGGAGGVGGCCFPMIAFSTSPGLEMCDKSILVLNSSLSPRPGRAVLDALWFSDVARKYPRTFSASCSSSELECVFFSVTPTAVRASRIALLLTSSSLARSLIRILLIRLFVPPDCPAKSSCQPHGFSYQLSVASGQLPVVRPETLEITVARPAAYDFWSVDSGATAASASGCSNSGAAAFASAAVSLALNSSTAASS